MEKLSGNHGALNGYRPTAIHARLLDRSPDSYTGFGAIS